MTDHNNVQRYKPMPGYDGLGVTMHPTNTGAYVRFQDYEELSLKFKPLEAPDPKDLKLPSICDGYEQEAWEDWAKRNNHEMTQHPLHYLFLDSKTDAARGGWKGGLSYASAKAGELLVETNKRYNDLMDTFRAIFEAVGYTDEYAKQWPKEKVSATFKRWFDEQISTAKAETQKGMQGVLDEAQAGLEVAVARMSNQPTGDFKTSESLALDIVNNALKALYKGPRGAEPSNLRKALQFYADKHHFTMSDDSVWDTVSGEPQNYWCDEAGTATVEDGQIARLALQGHPIEFKVDPDPQPAPNEEAWLQHNSAPKADSVTAPAGRVYSANCKYATVEWLQQTSAVGGGDPKNSRSWPTTGDAVYLTSHAQAADSVTAQSEPMPFEGGGSFEASTLRNFLAILHKDGGQYTATHGIIKSADDAEKLLYDLIGREVNSKGSNEWWRVRANEIEAEVAASGSTEAMRCFTDMRTLMQAVTQDRPSATDDAQCLLWSYRYYGSNPHSGYALVEVGTRNTVLQIGNQILRDSMSNFVDELCNAHNSVVKTLLNIMSESEYAKVQKPDAGIPTSELAVLNGELQELHDLLYAAQRQTTFDAANSGITAARICLSNLRNKVRTVAPAETAAVLPDGSALMTASFPLPDDHWLYAPRIEGWDQERDCSPELPKAILTHGNRDDVMAAAQYAIRAATKQGTVKDYDPDAMVQNFVIAMCGHYGMGRPHPAKPENTPIVRVVAPSLIEYGPQDQTRFFGDPKGGNCTEASLATLLGLKLSDIPDFPHESPYQFWESLDEYLKSIGYVRLMMGNNYVPECNYLASGPSSRGCSHMVVMYEGKLAHDPHPSREGLLKVEIVHMIVPILNPVKPD